jgi:hypothetical protein
VPYCGKPRGFFERRDEYAEGCGCDLTKKPLYKDSACPRRMWGPGLYLGRKIRVIREPMYMTKEAGVHDLFACVRSDPSDGTGLGDGLVAVTIAEGIRRRYPDRKVRIVLTVKGRAEDWIKFFWDGEVVHDVDILEKPGEWRTWMQYKTFGLEDVQAMRHGLNRHQKFALRSRVKPVMPTYQHDENALLAAQKELTQPLLEEKPIIFLAPFANNIQRQWPKVYSIKLVELLKKRGYWVGVIDSMEGKKRTKEYPCMRYWGWGPQQTAGLFRYADLVIGLDSGMCHFAGMLGVPTLAICGVTHGDTVFGFYPAVQTIQAQGECAVCIYRKSKGFHRACAAGCELMMDLKAEAVAERVAGILSNKGVRHVQAVG